MNQRHEDPAVRAPSRVTFLKLTLVAVLFLIAGVLVVSKLPPDNDDALIRMHAGYLTREVLRCVWERDDAHGQPQDGALDIPLPGESVESIQELPDDLLFVLCPEITAWRTVNTGERYSVVLCVRSVTVLRDHVMLVDGRNVLTVPARDSPSWLARGIVVTKTQLLERRVSLPFK